MDPAHGWKALLIPDAPLLEMVVRGSVMYLGLFVLLRVVLKRQTGTLGMTDLLLITLLADASQNAMAGEYRSLPNGLVLVSTILFWNYFLDWLSFHSPRVRRWIEPPPLLLIQDGKLLRHNMKRELISKDELMGQLREQGISDLVKVKKAYIEGDGRISVIQQEEDLQGARERKPI
ncbi:MAG: DUF421 domain-containing protein [Nitrospirae bacterium]|nr:DUF421 domain-containing protein [Candidatus Manganitrophaceae bacterium]